MKKVLLIALVEEHFRWLESHECLKFSSTVSNITFSFKAWLNQMI